MPQPVTTFHIGRAWPFTRTLAVVMVLAVLHAPADAWLFLAFVWIISRPTTVIWASRR